MLTAGGLIERGETETDAYLRVAADRYLMLRTHEWSDEVLDRLRRAERRRYKKRRRLPPKRHRRWPY
jgi:triphosphoribosyl-dephospho-CoA synthetase